MIKLFVTLYLMVLASFGFFIASGIFLDSAEGFLIETSNIERELSEGTFNLLDESVQGLSETEIDDLVSKYKNIFGNDFELIVNNQIILDDTQTKNLTEGAIVIHSQSNHNEAEVKIKVEIKEETKTPDTNFIYRKLSGTSKSWKLNLDMDTELAVNENGIKTRVTSGQYVEGMLYLIQQKLIIAPKTEWISIIQTMQKHYPLTISLTTSQSITDILQDKKKQLEDFNNSKVINSTQGSHYATFVKKLDQDQSVQVGPIKIPWFIVYLPTIVLLSFVLSIATALFLWLWPLWSNLQKIKKAAIDFGEGNYDSRIPYSKRSSIAGVGAAFNSMAERTQNSIRSQKELTSAVSHELRTPVTRMRFALEMLEDTKDENERKRYQSDINGDIDELDELLVELLSYARFDQASTELNLKQEKLIPWMATSMNKLMPLAKDKNLSYRVEGIEANESSLFEPKLLRRVLDNLVQNAIRYANHNIEVTLCKDNKNYLIIVDDDGSGIEEQQRQKVFEAFSRIDPSRHKSTGGFGLGLAISDKIIKAHQGHISIKTSKLGGAKFVVSWPYK